MVAGNAVSPGWAIQPSPDHEVRGPFGPVDRPLERFKCGHPTTVAGFTAESTLDTGVSPLGGCVTSPRGGWVSVLTCPERARLSEGEASGPRSLLSSVAPKGRLVAAKRTTPKGIIGRRRQLSDVLADASCEHDDAPCLETRLGSVTLRVAARSLTA